MLKSSHEVPAIVNKAIIIKNTRWLRAKYSGLIHTKVKCGDHVKEGDHIATITDPYGKFRHQVKAPRNGYVINVNEASLVYQGDAIFNISSDGKGRKETAAEEEA